MRGIIHFSTQVASDPGVSCVQWKPYYHERKQIQVQLEEILEDICEQLGTHSMDCLSL